MAELLWTPTADEQMTAVETAPSSALAPLQRLLAQLAAAPDDARLGTRQFLSDEYAFVRATPVRHGDWHVLWTPEPGDGALRILWIGELRI